MSATEEPRTYLVECFWPGVDEHTHGSAADRARAAALQLAREGHEIEFLGSILIPTDETVLCFFKGRECDVRFASERAGLPFERLLIAVRIWDDVQESAAWRGARSSSSMTS